MVELVTRSEWGARPPKSPPSKISGSVNMTFVHHTAGSWVCDDKSTCIAQIQDIQNLHMDTNGNSVWGNTIGIMGEEAMGEEARGGHKLV